MVARTVLHIHKVSGLSGSERHLAILLPALRAQGWEPKILLLPVEDGQRAIEEFERLDIEVFTAPPGPDLNPLLVARIAKIIRSERPDLVHTHLIHADVHGQAAARLARVPAMSSIHATHDFYTGGPTAVAARLAGRAAAKTIAISHHVERFARRHRLAPPDRLETVHYGIDTEAWSNPKKNRAEVRAELAVDDDQVLVGVASRIYPGKGHDVLIDAVARTLEHVPGLRLVIAGDGPIRSEVEAHARDRLPAAAVDFTGYIDDVPSFLGACDIVAFPTTPAFGEGFGLAALEAMAGGVALVASDLDSLPELVDHDNTGLLVAPESVDALTDALTRLATDPGLRKRLGDAGRQRARDEFTIAAMAEHTASLYEDVIHRRR